MRLGAYRCVLEPETHTHRACGAEEISERHRHRYEFNPAFEDMLSENGLTISGRNPESELVEIIEALTIHGFRDAGLIPSSSHSPWTRTSFSGISSGLPVPSAVRRLQSFCQA